MRRPVRERLRLILAELGTGLAGRPDDLAEVAPARAPRPARDQPRAPDPRRPERRDRAVHRATPTPSSSELEQNKKDVARWVTASADSAEISASRSADAGGTRSTSCPAFLDELRPTMHALGETADEQIPLLGDLRAAAPDLNEFFHRLGPFSEASLPALDSLGESSKAGTAGVPASRSEEVNELLELSKDAPGLREAVPPVPRDDGRPQPRDRERRAREGERAAGARPHRDPGDANFRGLAPKGGFTGLEAIWDYVYWQTLSINMFDDVGHIVRLGADRVRGPGACSQIRNYPPAPRQRGGRGALREVQPVDRPPPAGRERAGLHARPGADAVGRRRRRDSQTAERVGGRRAAPSSAARRRARGAAVPGQPDPSEPNVTLPAARPRADRGPRAPAACCLTTCSERVQELDVPDPQASPETLLDFLLTP